MSSTLELLNVALGEHRAGNLPVAERLYRQVLDEAPELADAWHLLGALYVQAGRPREATMAIERAIELNPANADYYSHLGAAYGALGEHQQAVDELRRAVRLAPHSATAHYNLGTALRNAEAIEEAVASFRHAIAASPAAPEAHYNLANALRDLSRHDEAEASYREAIRERPGYIKAMINLANLLCAVRRRDEAVEVARQAAAADPRHARSHASLGTILRDAGRFDEAVAALETAVALDPQAAEAQNNLGTAYQARAQFDRAWQHYQQALALDPELPDVHFSIGTYLLRQGELERGFAEYEWRWRCKSFSTRKFDQPRWHGEPLAGRTILLHAEQGLGDTIQFVRYARDVAARGGRVTLECQPGLVKLLASVAGIERIVAAGTSPGEYDVHCPLLSLPGVLGLSSDQLWRGPYLVAERARVARWRERLAGVGGFRVGVCWQGNPEHLFDRQRSFPLERLAPLAAIPGVALVNLQKGSTPAGRAGAVELVELGDALDADGAFLDTAAVIGQLDLVVSADTAIAHLAGALGARAWVALSAHHDWRWFTGRDDSPWYPTLRLFRQQELDRWDDVFERMAAALAELVAREKPA